MILRHKFTGGDGLERIEIVHAFERTQNYARAYAKDNKDELEIRYGKRYLAIAQDVGVIDSGENKLLLAERLQRDNDQRGIIIDTIDNLIKPKQYNN